MVCVRGEPGPAIGVRFPPWVAVTVPAVTSSVHQYWVELALENLHVLITLALTVKEFLSRAHAAPPKASNASAMDPVMLFFTNFLHTEWKMTREEAPPYSIADMFIKNQTNDTFAGTDPKAIDQYTDIIEPDSPDSRFPEEYQGVREIVFL